MADSNFISVTNADPFTLIESNEVILAEFGGNVNGVEAYTNADVEISYFSEGIWSDWIFYSAGQMLAEFPDYNQIVKFRISAAATLNTLKSVTIEDTAAGMGSFTWNVTTKVSADEINLPFNKPITSPAYNVPALTSGNPFRISELGMYQVQLNGVGQWGPWINYSKNEDISGIATTSLIRLKVRSPTTFNRTKIVRLYSGDVTYYSWSLSTPSASTNTFDVDFTLLPAANPAPAPVGMMVPTNLITGGVVGGLIDANGFGRGTGQSRAFVTTSELTGGVIYAKAKFNVNVGLGAFPQIGILFCNAAQDKGFYLSYTGFTGSLFLRTSVITSGSSVNIGTFANYVNALSTIKDMWLHVFYNPVTGQTIARVTPNGSLPILNKAANVASFNLVPLNCRHVGVICTGNNSIQRIAALSVTDKEVSLPKAVNIDNVFLADEVIAGATYGGFRTKYASIGGVPLNIISSDDTSFTATYPTLDELTGSYLFPAGGGVTRTEFYNEFISDDASIIDLKTHSITNTVYSNISSFAPTPSAGEINNVFTYLPFDSFLYFMSVYTGGSAGVSGFYLSFDPVSGFFEISITGTPDDSTTPMFFYIKTLSSAFRKFQVNRSSSTTISSVVEVFPVTFPTVFNAEYATEYESKPFTVAVAGNVTSSRGHYAINTGGGFGVWIAAGTSTAVAVGDIVKFKQRTSSFKDRTVTTNIVISGSSYEWKVRNKLDRQYEMDLSLTPEEQIIKMASYANEITLSINDLEIAGMSSIAGDRNTRTMLRARSGYKYQGEVEVYYNRINLSGFGAYKTPDLFLDTLTPTNQMIVDKFNALYGTALDIDDFLFPSIIPTPDRDGELYTVWPAADNLVYVGSLNVIVYYSPFTPEVIPTTNSATSVVSGGSAVLADKLFVIGGLNSVGGIGGISVLDLSTFAWTHKTQTTVGYNNKAVAVGGSVYCGSGEGHSNPANVGIFKLVPSGSDFTFSLDYSFPYGGTLISYALTADASNGIIYLTGGFSSETGLSDNHWRLSTITGEWQQLASLPVALCNTNSFYHNGKVYVVGGLKTTRSSTVTNTSSKLYCYTIATNSWATLADLTIPVHDTSLGVLKGKLVAISGSPGTDASPSEAVANVIQHYDFTANTWHVQDKPAPGLRMIAQGGIYDQSLYLWGGSTDIGAANPVNSLLKIS